MLLAVLVLLYGCTAWTLTKRLEKELDGQYTRMLRAVINKSWKQHPTRSKDEFLSDVLLWTHYVGGHVIW